jgi:hypothetical protein
MKINLPQLFRQTDPKYSGTPIGNSNMGAIGCLTVCGAMTACYFGHSINPSTLVDLIKYQGNLWIWSELSRIYPDIIYKGLTNTPYQVTDNQMNIIRGQINKGIPVFILIQTPYIYEHWLLAVDYSGDDLKCADPLTGTVHPITDYGVNPKISICAYGWYDGPIPNQNGLLTPLDECLSMHTKLVTEIDALKKDMISKDQVIKNLNQQINDRNLDIVRINNEKQALAEKENGCQSRLLSVLEATKDLANLKLLCQEQEKKIEGLNGDIQSLKLQVAGYKSRWSQLSWSFKKIILEKFYPNL